MKEFIKSTKGKIAIGAIVVAIIGIVVFILLNQGALKLNAQAKGTMTVEYGEAISLEPEDYLDPQKVDKDVLKAVTVETDAENEAEKEYPAIGKYKVTLTYKDENKIVDVEVKDTIAPVFGEEFKSELETPLEVTPNYDELYLATDLQAVTISCEDSEVDYSTLGEYKATIVATDASENKETKEILLKVVEPSITFEKTELSLTIGKSMDLTPTVLGKDQTVTYKSSDSKIVSVDEKGKITAVKTGTANITATANGKEAVVKVTATAKSTSSASSSFGSSDPRAAFNIINEYRKQKGIAPLVWNGTIAQGAQIRANEMPQLYSHMRPNGDYGPNILVDLGYMTKPGDYSFDECIAYGYPTAEGVVRGWQNSPPHNSSLLNANSKYAAVARYGNYWVFLSSTN